MILSENDILQGQVFEADLCIIGGGPAAISIALEFLNTDKQVILITGGKYTETIENQDLHKGLVHPESTHEPLEENRRRAYGGGTIAWGGRCIPLDPIDFEKRSWIPNSGWPVAYEQMIPFFQRAMILNKAGAFSFSASESFPGAQQEILPGMDDDTLSSDHLERWSTPVNFAREYQKELENSPNIKILLNAHVTNILTENQKDLISGVEAVAGGKKFNVQGQKYVLACGGIENPRLLLASKSKFHPLGIGNDLDVVGRYYMAHFMGIFAEVAPRNRDKIIFNFEQDKEGVYCRRRWWVTQKAQELQRIGNIIFFLHRPKNQEGHRDALFSARYVAKFAVSLIKDKSIKKAKIKWSAEKENILAHSKIILKEGLSDLPNYFRIAIKRFQKRRLPIVLPSVNNKTLGIYFQSEHIPHPESRIMLSETEVDHLGMPRVVVKVANSDLDRKTIMEGHKIIVERYQKAEAGEIFYDEEGLSKFLDHVFTNFNSGAHHLGTTRMSNDPSTGVVDENCKVHGVSNLYIAGASVFPTGGHANPTLTLVALALRLADHLKKG